MTGRRLPLGVCPSSLHLITRTSRSTLRVLSRLASMATKITRRQSRPLISRPRTGAPRTYSAWQVRRPLWMMCAARTCHERVRGVGWLVELILTLSTTSFLPHSADPERPVIAKVHTYLNLLITRVSTSKGYLIKAVEPSARARKSLLCSWNASHITTNHPLTPLQLSRKLKLPSKQDSPSRGRTVASLHSGLPHQQPQSPTA